MKKVLTFGVFDYFHYGHLKLLERAKLLGDYLIVAVQYDEEIHKTKPEAKVLYSLSQRMEMIKALKCVDEVIPYKQVCDDIKLIDFDVLAQGGDQNHSGFASATAWCAEHGKEVVMISRTPDICSSGIKKELNK
ncbi:MAG: adenylyltransferase/cytidyltransferase family protein [Clostridia bacterium]|nr:adenylyltransferase/cytidyltransferase family protein [Clostridia bacterium]